MPSKASETAKATKKSAVAAPAALLEALSTALTDAALHGEEHGFEGAYRTEATAFVAGTMMKRKAGEPAIALETLTPTSGHRTMQLAVINDDMPFLVDSIATTVAATGLGVDRILHPVLSVRRDNAGELTQILDGHPSGEKRESVIYMEIDRADAKQRTELVAAIKATLADVRAAVRDWGKMQETMAADADRIADVEGAALLRWFLDRNFTQLGHESRDRGGKVTDALGICANHGPQLLADATIDRAFQWFERGGRTPLLVKSNQIATVHRRVLIDLVIVPVHGDKGLEALSIHAGMWTSSALSAPPEKVPVLRAQLAGLNDKFGFDPSGHAGKALVHAMTALPHDLLISFDAASLERLALTAMSLSDRPRAKIVTVLESLGRHLFAFVWLPRDDVSTGRRLAIAQMIEEAAHANVIGWTIVLEDGAPALLRYTLDMRDGGKVPGDDALDKMLQVMVRGWVPEVEARLAELGDEGRAAALAIKYANSFPPAYRATYGAAEAAQDIVRLRDTAAEISGDKPVHKVRFYRDGDDKGEFFRMKAYAIRQPLALSDVVPALENFGFRVIEEVPTALDGGASGYIHDFQLARMDGEEAEELINRADTIEQALACVLMGESENDSFNQLIVSAGLDPKSIVWLRAWFRYLRQAGLTYGMDTVVAAMRNARTITEGLIGLFVALHDPKQHSDKAAAKARDVIDAGLAHVKGVDDDRILRTTRAVIEATLRTNAFADSANEALAFKIDSSLVPGLPKPLPWREIWVYSPRLEGIHLRSGPVARGGLRWSDRRDDFRTEILGLMKAQRVKNAVIVPAGAKGGFYPKQLPNPAVDRDAWFNEGKESYRVFIRTLLSVTDNIVSGKVVHPDNVVIRDEEDPYFVVAADKGTATFSDVANAIALDHNFWLGDAFASGGSNGYDHKAMGITARGAWISVQRHFAEMGIDVQSEPTRVVGCGDMSGDVFGNGMLLSKAIKLVAAFDHRHIFFDPDPADTGKSWTERKRLFDLPRSSWEDYDKKLISKGGGVFSRADKTVKLTPEIKAMLGVDESEMEPAAIISAILKAEVDLIWFGGIGTYIKGSGQANVDVGDPGNDRVRVDGIDVRSKVIGEGANLGVTQAARIEYAQNGGRINTDFIDNSAGVDCSDNEVNIKIALNREVIENRLKLDARNVLLEKMTDNVSELVLNDNRLQALGLSIAQRGGAAALPSYVRLIEIFEGNGKLDRKVEGLASSEELLRRGQDERGLTRPELAVLLSTAKLSLQDSIEDGDLATDPSMEGELLRAFPVAMQEKFPDAIADHQLRKEIIATKVANRMINRLGLIHPFELAEEEGCSLADIAVMFLAAERLFEMDKIWAALDTAKIDEGTRLALFGQAAAAMGSQMADLLRIVPAGALPGEIVERLKPGVDRLAGNVDKLLSDVGKRNADQIAAKLLEAGGDAKLIEPVVRLFKIDGVVGLADLAERAGIDETKATKAFTHLGEELGLDWAQTVATRMSPSDPWERLLVNGLARDFQHMRLEFLSRSKGDMMDYVDGWLAANADRVQQFTRIVNRARLSTAANGVMLAQIAGQARGLLAR